MGTILPYQLSLRQELPQVIGNVEYKRFQETLERISELIVAGGLDEIFIAAVMEATEQEGRREAEKRGKEYDGMSYN